MRLGEFIWQENINMDELRLDLSNCYGIQKMNTSIDYSNNNVAIIYVPNGNDVINDIYSKKNQSAWMIKAYRKHINDGAMNTLELVAMITPENIHLNSFMFEPILDMSLKHLHDLYQTVEGFSV